MSNRSRIVLAFILAPLAPALLVAIPLGLWMTFAAHGGASGALGALKVVLGYCLMFGLPPTVLVGVPAYFLMRRRVTPTAGAVMWTGAACGGAGYLLFWAFAGIIGGETPGLGALVNGGLFLVFGALGGLAFWIVAAPALKADFRSFGASGSPGQGRG